MKLYAIAQLVGYKSEVTLVRVFKRATGMTSGECRKTHSSLANQNGIPKRSILFACIFEGCIVSLRLVVGSSVYDEFRGELFFRES